MAGCHPVRARAASKAFGSLVASAPRGGLEIALIQLRPLDVKVDPQRPAECSRRALALDRRLAQPVVHVQRMDVVGAEPREAGGGAGGVGAARHHHHAGRVRVDQPAAANRAGKPLESLLLGEHRGAMLVLAVVAPGARHPSRSPNSGSCSRARATKRSTGCGKPFSSTSPIGSNRRYPELPTESAPAAVTRTSPPSARATTRWVRLTSPPK